MTGHVVFEPRQGLLWGTPEEGERLREFLRAHKIVAAADGDASVEMPFWIGVDAGGLTATTRRYGGLGVGLHIDALVRLLVAEGFDAHIDGAVEAEPALAGPLADDGPVDGEIFVQEQGEDDESDDDRMPRSVVVSRLAPAFVSVLAAKVGVAVESAMVGGWLVLRYDDPAFSEAPRALVNRREVPLVHMFRGEIDIVVLQLSPVRVRTRQADVVTLAPGADVGMIPCQDLATLDEDGRELMLQLLTSASQTAQLVTEALRGTDLAADRNSLERALSPRSVGGPSNRDARLRATLGGLGLSPEIVEAMVGLDAPAETRIVKAGSIRSAAADVIVGPSSELSAVGSRPRLWARADDFYRTRPRAAVALGIAQVLLGVVLVIVGLSAGRAITVFGGTILAVLGALALIVSTRRLLGGRR